MVLCFFTLTFGFMVLLLAYLPPMDKSVITVASGLFTSFAGALTLHLRTEKTPPVNTVTTVVSEEIKSPPVKT